MVATMLSTSNPPAPNEITTTGGNLFAKAGSGMVTMTVVARFSPDGFLPLGFGYYTPGTAAPTPNTTAAPLVGTMQLASDTQTSDLARMVLPAAHGRDQHRRGRQHRDVRSRHRFLWPLDLSGSAHPEIQ